MTKKLAPMHAGEVLREEFLVPLSVAARQGPPPFSSINSIQRRRPVAPPCGLAAKLPLSTYELPESEIAGHWMKIAIVVEQRRAVFDTPGPDQEVDRLADCDAAST